MVAPVDMRRGIDGLSALVEQALQLSQETQYIHMIS